MIEHTYCMSKKSLPILYSKLVHEMGQDFLDIRNTYVWNLQHIWVNVIEHTVCPRSLGSYYKVSYCIKWVMTFWTYSRYTDIAGYGVLPPLTSKASYLGDDPDLFHKVRIIFKKKKDRKLFSSSLQFDFRSQKRLYLYCQTPRGAPENEFQAILWGYQL